MVTKIVTFTDLKAWERGHGLVLMVYKATENFPKQEKYALTSQMRRGVVSITSNLAEGFTRRGIKDKVRFYTMALGSLTELQNQLIITRDVGYITSNTYKKIQDQTIIVSKLINGLIKGIESRNS